MLYTGLPELYPRESSYVRRRSSKFMEGYIRGAVPVREVCTSNGLAPVSSETLTAFQERHPTALADLNLLLPPEESIHQPKTASRKGIDRAISCSF